MTPEFFSIASQLFGYLGRPVIRFGIAMPEGGVKIELYLRKIALAIIPQSKFDFA
jgi:hypothetical protein